MSVTTEIGAELDALRAAGTFKQFNTLLSPQGPVVEMDGRGGMLLIEPVRTSGLVGLDDRRRSVGDAPAVS